MVLALRHSLASPQLSRPSGKVHAARLTVRHALPAPSALSEEVPWVDDLECSVTPSRTVVLSQRPDAPLRPAAGRITPTKLAGLSAVLRVPIIRVEAMMQRSPAAVQRMEPEEVAQRLQQLCEALGLSPKQAAFMASKQPAYMLLTPLPDIAAKVRELAEALGVPPAAVLRTARTVPSILRRRTATVQRRVEAYSVLLRCSPLDVLHVLARGPEYLSDTPSSVRQRMIALGLVLRRPRCTIAAMLQARPDLVSLSPKVMNTKVNGLMSILNKEKRHVVTLLVKLPALLRCDLDRARAVFGGLQALLRKREGFTYAMVCHAPQLLLLPPRGLQQRCVALRRCLAASPVWIQQFLQLRPPGVAQLLLNMRGSLCAMVYLCERRRAGSVQLERLLAAGLDGGPAAALGELGPDFAAWMEWRRRALASRLRQRRAALAFASAAAGRGEGAPTQVQLRPGEQPQQPVRPLSAPAPVPLRHVGHSLASSHPALSPVPRPAPVPARVASVEQPSQQAGPARAPAPMPVLRQAPQHSVGSAPVAYPPAPFLHGSGASLRPAYGGQQERPHPAEAASQQNGDGPRARTEPGDHPSSTHLVNGRWGAAGPASCSTSGGSSNSSSRGFEGVDGEGTARDVGRAADCRQQPGASTSGRQPSWLQLQAEYRRSLQSRARRRQPASVGRSAAAMQEGAAAAPKGAAVAPKGASPAGSRAPARGSRRGGVAAGARAAGTTAQVAATAAAAAAAAVGARAAATEVAASGLAAKPARQLAFRAGPHRPTLQRAAAVDGSGSAGCALSSAHVEPPPGLATQRPVAMEGSCHPPSDGACGAEQRADGGMATKGDRKTPAAASPQPDAYGSPGGHSRGVSAGAPQQPGRRVLSSLLQPGRGLSLRPRSQQQQQQSGEQPCNSGGSHSGGSGTNGGGGGPSRSGPNSQAGASAHSEDGVGIAATPWLADQPLYACASAARLDGHALEERATPLLTQRAPGETPYADRSSLHLQPSRHDGAAPGGHLWVQLQRPVGGGCASGAVNGAASHATAAAGTGSPAEHVRPGKDERSAVFVPVAPAQLASCTDAGEEQDRSLIIVGEDGMLHELGAIDREKSKPGLTGRGRHGAEEGALKGGPQTAHALGQAVGAASPR